MRYRFVKPFAGVKVIFFLARQYLPLEDIAQGGGPSIAKTQQGFMRVFRG